MFATRSELTMDLAKKMMAAAEAEARRNNWNVAIAIVDASANLMMFQKLDDTQPGSIAVCQGKARTAANFKRATKALEEMIASGRQGFLAIEGIVPIQGGLPVIVEGRVVGAVGVSGVTSAQDEQVAQAAITALAL